VKIDGPSRRLYATFAVVSALALLLAGLLVAPGARVKAERGPRPVDFDEPTGLPPAGSASRAP
jgi:hypothetical protein